MQILARKQHTADALSGPGGQVRFFYVDPGLRDSPGHHGNTCRAVIREVRSRGIEAAVFACDQIRDPLRAELDAAPLFRPAPQPPLSAA